MNKIKIEQAWEFTGLKTLVLTNNMAPLSIVANETAGITLRGEISGDMKSEDFDWEDYITSKFDKGKLKLEFEKIPALGRDFGGLQLTLSVPAAILLEIEIENLPLSLSGLQNDLRISSENAPIAINDCDGDKDLESENGPVRILNSKGSVIAELENGPLSAEDLEGASLKIESENGPVKLRQVAFDRVEIETENGSVHYLTLPVEGGNYQFETENGIVHLGLPVNLSFSLQAETRSGRLKSKLDAEIKREDRNFSVENILSDLEPTKIRIRTENGLIKLTSDSKINVDFIKGKFDQLKDAFQNATNSQEKEKVIQMVNKVNAHLKKAVDSINEAQIKDRVNEAIDKLKDISENFDYEKTKDTVVASVEEVSKDAYEGVRDGLKNVKSEFDDFRDEHLSTDSIKDYIHKVVNSPLIKPYLGRDKKDREKEEIAERSRLKILDMLESGKITSEEAEKLLRAIDKE